MATAEEMYLADFDDLPFYRAIGLNSLDIIEASLKAAEPDSTMFMYYILAEFPITQPDPKNANINIQKMIPTVYRVKAGMVGRSIVLAPTAEIDLKEAYKPNGYYLLPKIPYDLVGRMGAFFRQVDKLHGTEATVVLTYDPTFKDSEDPSQGWGCIAPKQENNSVHCYYDMTSIMSEKPEHVFIVGSAHSHPGMSAYFSGTDHDDQADWEGVHITYGWKPNSKETEYYIEVIINGVQYPFNPVDIFMPFPEPVIDTTEINGWLVNVTKKTFEQSSTHQGYQHSSNTPTRALGPSNSSYTPSQKNRRMAKFPDNAPLPTENTIIARISESVMPECPACGIPVVPHLVKNRRCVACGIYFALGNETLVDILQIRAAESRPYQLDIDPFKAGKPIVFWTQEADGTHTFSDDQRDVALKK